MVTNVFEADIGTSPSPVPLATAGAAAWFEVLDIIPPHQLALEDVHDRIVTEWKADQDLQRLQDMAQQVADLLTQGVPPAGIEAQLGVTFQQSDPLLRTDAPPDGLSAGSLQAAFGGALGDVSTAATPDGAGIVVQRIAEVLTPDFDPEAPPSDQVTTTQSDIADQMAVDYVFDVRGRTKITYNMDLVRQLTGTPAPAAQ